MKTDEQLADELVAFAQRCPWVMALRIYVRCLQMGFTEGPWFYGAAATTLRDQFPFFLGGL